MGLEAAVLLEARALGASAIAGAPLHWLPSRGHLDPIVQRDAPAEVVEALDELHAALGGNRSALARKAATSLQPDLVVASSGQLVEIDEIQHFTAARLTSLSLYPSRVSFGFSIDHYRSLIDTWKAKANAVFTRRWSPDFDFVGGRRAQRAYYDALKDLLAPTFTGMPVLRIPVPDGDAHRAAHVLAAQLA